MIALISPPEKLRKLCAELLAFSRAVFCITVRRRRGDRGMKSKGFGKRSQSKKVNSRSLDPRYTEDGTRIYLEDIPEDGVILFMGEIMLLTEGRLREKVYYPTSVEGKVIYPNAPFSSWSKICTRYGIKMPETAAADSDGTAIGFWDWVNKECLPVTVVDCVWECLRLLSKDVLSAYRVPFTGRPRENRYDGGEVVEIWIKTGRPR